MKGSLESDGIKPEMMCYPEDLCLLEADRRWWVIHTKPNQERKLSRQLR